MWTVYITSVRHVLKVNGYGGRQAKVNEKSQCFKGWETLDNKMMKKQYLNPIIDIYTITTESLLDNLSENTITAPEAPNGTEAGAKEYNFDFWEKEDVYDNL